MKQKTVIFLYVILSTICGVGRAQVLVEPEVGVPLLKMQTSAMAVPPGTAATTMDLVVDEHPDGGGVIDVRVTDPGVAVSLIQPSGVEVTVVNALSLGFRFEVYLVSEDDSSLIVSPLLELGTHTLIELPPGAASGTYQVKADSTAVAEESGLSVFYHSSSSVRAGLAVAGTVYKPNDTVIIAALVFDDTAALTGATIAAQVAKTVSLSSQVTFSNYALVEEVDVDADTKRYTYRADLTNREPPR